MTIARIEPGPIMSQAVTTQGMVYLSGQVGDPAGDIEEQTRSALSSVDRLLQQAGSDKSHIVQATVWLADMADFQRMNAVWSAWIDPANPPARATGEVPLANPRYKIEVIVVAALKTA